MEFDKSRCYSAINADELRAGDKVVVADNLADLKEFVRKNDVHEIEDILSDKCSERFGVWGMANYALAYLVERGENCTNCDMGEMDEDDWIGCSPDKIGKEDVAKTWCCDNWKPKTEDKWCKNCGVEECSRAGVDANVRCPAWQPKAEQKAEHDCQSCKYKNCGFKDFNTKNECDRWEAEVKAEMPELIPLGNGQYAEKSKTEKKYRPFETIGELINEWVIKGGEWQHREKTMPLIWVRGKNCSVNRLITSFDETENGDRVMICGLDCSMEDLFNIYTFLDGSPCGVEE